MSKVFVPYFNGEGFLAGEEYPVLNYDYRFGVSVLDEDGEICFIFIPDSAHFGYPGTDCGFVKEKGEEDIVLNKRYLHDKGEKWKEFMEYGVNIATFLRLLEWKGPEEALKYFDGEREKIADEFRPKKQTYAFAPVGYFAGCYPTGTVIRVEHQVDESLYEGVIVYVPGEDREKMTGEYMYLRTDKCAHLPGDNAWVLFEDYPDRWEKG
jgi:hypothetical protein